MAGADGGSSNTSAYLQVLGLGTDTGDASPGALLFFDRRRVLFNAGEGFQRFAVEHGVRLSRVGDVLLTRNDAAAAGGLPGLCLTLADPGGGGGRADGGAPVRVWGPPGLATLATAVRSFVDTRVAVIEPREFGGGEASGGLVRVLPAVVQDDAFSVRPVLVTPAGDGKVVTTATTTTTITTAGSGDEDAPPAAKRARAAPRTLPPCAIYIAALAPVAGKFKPDAAAAAGVPRGPLYGRLKAGQPVTLADGRVVQPGDVCEPGAPGPVVIVVDAPTRDHAAALAASDALAAWQAGGAEADRVAAVLHLTPAAVVATPEYGRWASRFNGTAIFANAAATQRAPVAVAAATLAAQLAAVDSTLFPLHQVGGEEDDGDDNDAGLTGFPAGVAPSETIVPGTNLLKFHLRPLSRAGLDATATPPPLDATAIQRQLACDHGDALADARAAVAAARAAAPAGDTPPCLHPPRRGRSEIVSLGTGAAQPSKYRNVSATLVRVGGEEEGEDGTPPTVDGGPTLLLDCGEGTAGQLVRALGAGAARRALAGLAAVWISHIHADHHAGLPGVLAARCAAVDSTPPPLLIIGPRPFRRVLAAYDALAPTGTVFLDCADVAAATADGEAVAADPQSPAALLARAKTTLRLAHLATVRVHHCAHAFGLVLRSTAPPAAGGYTLAFSGDTTRCPALADAARGAALLVHEATFEDGMEGEAAAKRHSTTGDAIAAAQAAGAAATVLTHFSQRYPKVPALMTGDDAQQRAVDHTVGIAFDLLRLDLADGFVLPALTRPLARLIDALEMGALVAAPAAGASQRESRVR